MGVGNFIRGRGGGNVREIIHKHMYIVYTNCIE